MNEPQPLTPKKVQLLDHCPVCYKICPVNELNSMGMCWDCYDQYLDELARDRENR